VCPGYSGHNHAWYFVGVFLQDPEKTANQKKRFYPMSMSFFAVEKKEVVNRTCFVELEAARGLLLYCK
jgi:hypothetical protein